MQTGCAAFCYASPFSEDPVAGSLGSEILCKSNVLYFGRGAAVGVAGGKACSAVQQGQARECAVREKQL